MGTSTTGVIGNVINLDTMGSNEKTINSTDAEPVSTTNAQADGDGPKYLGVWELFPITIALGLAIFIIGLASNFVPI